MIDFEKAFVGLSISVFLICFTAYISWRVFKKKRIVAAADKFKNIVIDELTELYPEGINHKVGNEITDILRGSHNIIAAAVVEFRSHVSRKNDFDSAWDDFTGVGIFRGKEEKPKYNQYSFTGRNNHFYEEPKKVFISKLEKLLSFADKP